MDYQLKAKNHIVVGFLSGNNYNAILRVTCLHCKTFLELFADNDKAFLILLDDFMQQHENCVNPSLN